MVKLPFKNNLKHLGYKAINELNIKLKLNNIIIKSVKELNQ
jgi:hypothetical protein